MSSLSLIWQIIADHHDRFTQQLQVKYQVETYDGVLCRYLRARKFNVDAAALMISQSIARRDQDKPELIIAEGPEACLDCPERAFIKFYPHYYRGYDRSGRPILYDKVGQMNLQGVKCVTTLEGMVRYHWTTMLKNLADRYKEASSKGYANPRFGLVSVLDLAGLSHKTIGEC